MTTFVNRDGIKCIKADEGKAVCRVTEQGPSPITSVSLGKDEPFENWKDCALSQQMDVTSEDKDAALRRFGVEV